MGTRLWQLVLSLPIFMLSLTIHEFAHAWMAKKHGDPTAEQLGRLTLNPLAHLDPLGSIMFVVSSLSGFGFGWAKPVPIQLGNARQPLRALFWVSISGPLSNLIQAGVGLLGLFLLKLAGVPSGLALLENLDLVLSGRAEGIGLLLAAVLGYYVIINIVLMLFNLLPVPPLDGAHALMGILPWRMARVLAQLEPYGFIILLVLLSSGLTTYWIGYPLVWFIQAMAPMLGLGLS